MDVFEAIETCFKDKYKGWDGAKQFEGSGERLRRLVEEMCWSPGRIEEEVEKCLKAVFDDGYDEMLVSEPTSVWTFCPHHILPCNFQVHIGYIPSKGVLGLSKFTRIAEILGKRPIMQESYSRELADTLWKGLEPEGVGVFVRGEHGCMSCRGVKQRIGVSTTVLRGSFKEDGIVRQEFYRMVGR